IELGGLEGPAVWADPDEMRQVMLNLLVNACDACAKGCKVSVRRAQTEQRSGVEVSDNGPGIPAAVLPRVFEPFFTTKPPGAGTGLGLTIVRDLMGRHEGHIALTSNEAGTRVVCLWRTAVPEGREVADIAPSRVEDLVS